MAEVGTPRNTIIGHTVGVVAGALSLALFGLLDAPSVCVSGVTLGRVAAIALAVAITGGVLRILRSAHPPAGATTIIVASGLLAKPRQMLDILIGVLLVTIAGWCLNRLMGVPAPVWAAPR
jgi:CBS domain-containing membrane protein